MLTKLARRALVAAFAAAILLFALTSLYSIVLNLAERNIWSNDFFAIWSFAKFTTARAAATIYDNAAIHDFQVDLGSSPTFYLPCPYPPSFLLLIAPLGLFSYYAAYAIWIFGTFVFYLIVSIPRQSSRIGAVLFVLAPASIVTFASGQTGFLTSALIVGGFRFAAERPVLGGVLFGLATIKPQLGILIPVALISSRLRRAAAVACVTAAVIVLASAAVFGWQVWPIWLATIGGHADWAARVASRYTVTIIGNLGLLGVGLRTARWAQAGFALLVAIFVWLAFRRGATSLAVAAALVGTFLATPYAFAYDTPMATNAAVALLAEERRRSRPPGVVTILVAGLSLMLPVIIALTWKLSMMRSIPMVLLFGLIVWKALGRRGARPMAVVAPVGEAAVGQ